MSNFTSTATPTVTDFTSVLSNETTPMLLSLDKLLDHLDFELWEIVINTFILPPINLIGIVLCSFSLWIFSRPSFEDPIFFYYKLLCFVSIIHLSHNIPECILFSLKYFPMINTFALNIYQIFYVNLSLFLFHFEEILQMAILLHKMKLYVPFVRKYFTSSPQFISLSLGLTCLFIDLPFTSSLKIAPLSNYYYINSNGVKQTDTFYYYTLSDFGRSFFGQILIGFTSVFLNQFMSLLVGVTLNIVSYVKFKLYSNRRKREFEHLQMSSINNRPTTSREIEQQRQRERTEQQIERNMYRMSLTLCTISIISRILSILVFFLNFFFKSFSSSHLTETVGNLIFTLVPTVSTFIFYSFSQMFRDETKRVFRLE